MSQVNRRTLVYVAVGVLGFSGFLATLGARLEPPTITMVLCAAALALLLHSLYRMVEALVRGGSDVALEQQVVLGGVAKRELREEKRRVLRAINELQFDYEMGKLSDDDYRSVRELYEMRAIEVMRELSAEPQLHPRLLADLAEARGDQEDEAQEDEAQEDEAQVEAEAAAPGGGA